ncbi:MAG: hypothetical protein HY046_13355, partial [Acidobacteria bacterium]|nr:hypothetical protein [Acidobacteriota bacterium]
DGNLTGSITSQMGAATISRGYVSGNTFSFTFTMNVGGGGPAEITMSGTIDGNNIKGSASMGGQTMEVTGSKPTMQSTEAEMGGLR